MKKLQYTLVGSNSKKFLLDVTLPTESKNENVIIFSHGFKGFKSWGCFDLMSNYFAENNMIFIKFNFSHNGTTLEKPDSFDDLDSFSKNNFSREMYDLNVVINWTCNKFPKAKINLLGHSRGGGISLLNSASDKRIKSVTTWGSPSDFISRFSKDKINEWKKNGVIEIYNSRTEQMMSLSYQFYEDCIINRSNISIKKAVLGLNIPQLIVHGSADETVNLSEALLINSWNSNSVMNIIKNANHTFNARHPYSSSELPNNFINAIRSTINFINLPANLI